VKLNSQPAQYEKNKIDKDKSKKKNNVGKHCSNPQCFREKKTTKLNSQPVQYETNKIDKDNSGKKNKKNHKKGEKTMWGNTVANPQCFKKKTTKLNLEPAPYLKNKINKNNSEKKNTKK